MEYEQFAKKEYNSIRAIYPDMPETELGEFLKKMYIFSITGSEYYYSRSTWRPNKSSEGAVAVKKKRFIKLPDVDLDLDCVIN